MLKALKFLVICVICLMIMGASVLYGFSSLFAPPNMDETLIPDAASQFYDINGNVIYTTLSEERRIPVTIDKIPKHVQQAFIAIEDNRFYEHSGIDYRGTARALVSTLSGREVQGGSTITQQLAKNLYYTQEKKLERKFAEVFTAFEFEKKFTKEEIFELYVNTIYFGSNYYGIAEAAQGYYGAEVSELTEYECAMLAGIPNAPSAYSLDTSPDLAKQRLVQVLDNMVENEDIDTVKAKSIIENRG